ncbi:hypothetical protein Q5P01_022153 [Channa striata]|uniref:Nuclear autoantigenic sperm protein n=1 Tax=Channa striata TaxID=64152 RepID=A0AA88LLL8_CHASR|nr:hypothetical protein Q5P01_022153 [Channa striata]
MLSQQEEHRGDLNNPCPSHRFRPWSRNMEEANKLIGTGKKHLVMGQVVEAVGALQEACGMLAKKYGDTADECGEAFFWCGKALLDLARVENSVLGNALEGVPEEEDEEKPDDSNVEGTENIDEKTRDELRVQVYDAMAEKENPEKVGEEQSGDSGKVGEEQSGDSGKVGEEQSGDSGKVGEEQSGDSGKVGEEQSGDSEKVGEEQSGDSEKVGEEQSGDSEKVGEEQSGDSEKVGEEQSADAEMTDVERSAVNENKSDGNEHKTKNGKEAEKEEQSIDKQEEEEEEEEEEMEDGNDAEMETDKQAVGDGNAEKDSDDEVCNLQLAWEMLEVAKVIYKRKVTKENQLMAAQAHLKLGEVSSESGNYTQALEDFQECLKLQEKYLDSDSRLLAETHYQLGLTYSLNLQYSRAIEELNNSMSVIKNRLDKLQELLDKAEGPDALLDERKEMEELKALLPEIKEKVEDATEGLKTEGAAAEAVKDVLDGGSTSSAFPDSSVQNGDSCSSKINGTSTNGVSTTNQHTPSAPVSDISHLVRKKRKPEESPVKEGVVKKIKQDDGQTDVVDKPHSNGVDKANGDSKSMEVESQ